MHAVAILLCLETIPVVVALRQLSSDTPVAQRSNSQNGTCGGEPHANLGTIFDDTAFLFHLPKFGPSSGRHSRSMHGGGRLASHVKDTF